MSSSFFLPFDLWNIVYEYLENGERIIFSHVCILCKDIHQRPENTRNKKRKAIVFDKKFWLAFIGKSIDVLKWAYQWQYIENVPKVLEVVSKYGTLEEVKWISDQPESSISWAPWFAAADKGRTDIVKYLWLRGFRHPRPDGSLAQYYAHRGNFEMVKWSFREGCKMSDEIFHAAVSGGQVKILKWFLKKGLCKDFKLECCPYASALVSNHLNVIKWLFGKGFFVLSIPWCVEHCANDYVADDVRRWFLTRVLPAYLSS